MAEASTSVESFVPADFTLVIVANTQKAAERLAMRVQSEAYARGKKCDAAAFSAHDFVCKYLQTKPKLPQVVLGLAELDHRWMAFENSSSSSSIESGIGSSISDSTAETLAFQNGEDELPKNNRIQTLHKLKGMIQGVLTGLAEAPNASAYFDKEIAAIESVKEKTERELAWQEIAHALHCAKQVAPETYVFAADEASILQFIIRRCNLNNVTFEN